MYLQKVISRKTFVKNLFFVGVLKVNDENSRIRIHPKISWIWNTVPIYVPDPNTFAAFGSA
jgi:hypothetical protein